jgi:predicted Rdx family selenoprotein
MILDDIWAAKKRGDHAHARELRQALKDYASTRREQTAKAPPA